MGTFIANAVQPTATHPAQACPSLLQQRLRENNQDFANNEISCQQKSYLQNKTCNI